MYKPLAMMEKIETFIKLPDTPEQEQNTNARSLEFYSKLAQDAQDCLFIDCVVFRGKVKEFASKEARIEAKKRMRGILIAHAEYCSLLNDRLSDFTQTTLQSMLHNEWVRAKRVYKFASDVGNSLTAMSHPKFVSSDIFLRLPSKCFYLDYSETEMFDGVIDGTFVQIRHRGNQWVAHFIHMLSGGELSHFTNCLCMSIEQDMSDGCVCDYDSVPAKHTLETDKGEIVEYNPKMFFDFFTNFCLYLQAANNDVEYTERTKATYRPTTDGAKPKNKIREVEEFGVGFKYSSISPTRRRVRCTRISENTTEEKRAYSANWRSAHWHRFWANDPDEPGKKKLITHWIKEVYVHGSKESKDVHVTKVNS